MSDELKADVETGNGLSESAYVTLPQESLLMRLGKGIVRPFRAAYRRLFGVPVEAPVAQPDMLSILPFLGRSIDALPPGHKRDALAGLQAVIAALPAERQRACSIERVAHGELILPAGIENHDLRVLLRGSFAVRLDVAEKQVLGMAPDVLGEISALHGSRTIAAVEAIGDAFFLRIPGSLLQEILAASPTLRTNLLEISKERQRYSRSLAALEKRGINPALTIAAVSMLQDGDNGEALDRTIVLASIRDMVAHSDNLFRIEEVRPGTTFVREGQTLSTGRLVLEGDGNVFINGGRVAKLRPGDFVGHDALTPDRLSSFRCTAITRMQLLTIDLDTFLQMRQKVEAALLSRRGEMLSSRRVTCGVASARFEEVGPEVVEAIHKQALQANYFVPVRSSGNELIFECGPPEDVLCWLGVRGQLSYRGAMGWKLQSQTPAGDFVLSRAADAPVTVARRDLIDANLRPAVRKGRIEDTHAALTAYVGCGLSFEQAQFLVGLGIVPQGSPNPDHLALFRESFPEIQEALSYIASWAEKPGYPEQRRRLASILLHLLIDTLHQIGITTLMKNPATRDIVLDCLEQMLTLPEIPDARFRAWLAAKDGPGERLRRQHGEDQVRWTGVGTTRGTTAFRARLLLDPKHGDLYRIDTTCLTPAQLRSLHGYVETLDHEVCPALVTRLETILAPLRSLDGALPIVTGRTKSAAGILDKIDRMQSGNAGKDPRPDYCLADLPDAVGSRVIVRDIVALEEAMATVEDAFQGCILEKDDFYGNPKKQHKPYRLVTYVVECNGVAAEIQLQTLASAVASTLQHDTIYKPYVPASLQDRALILSLLRRVAAAETRERGSPSRVAVTQEASGLMERSAPRYGFRSVSLNGECMCVYVSEGDPAWKDDLADARAYFQWHEMGNGNRVTKYYGSSAMDCSACIGTKSWKEFHAAAMERIKRMPNVPPEAIDAHVGNHVPLFVLETIGKDLDYEKNEKDFCHEIAARYTPEECRRIKAALEIARSAHDGQTYAIDKVDKETGAFKYSFSQHFKHIPYVNHCVQVARIGVECDLPVESIEALLLHDVVEDTAMTPDLLQQRGVSTAVIECVMAVTRDKKQESREEYMARVKGLTGEKRLLKPPDRHHNLLRAFNLGDNLPYLNRIVEESPDAFGGDFTPNAAFAKVSMRFHMLYEAVKELRDRLKTQ